MSKPANDSRTQVARVARQRLESLARAGVMELPKATKRVQAAGADSDKSEPRMATSASASPTIETMPSARPKGVSAPQSLFEESSNKPPMPLDQRPAALDVIRNEVVACQRCAAL